MLPLASSNMQLHRFCFALSLAMTAAPLAACVDDQSGDDELATDDATVGADAKADVSTGVYTYYFVSPDTRRCASPYCGGVFYRLANATQTRCIDGTKAERCHAPSSDWDKLALGDSGMQKVYDGMSGAGGEILVRATVTKKDWGSGLGLFANLNPREAWIGQGPNAAEGPLAKLEDSGVRCITTPCPSLRERKLNSSANAMLAEVGWQSSGATDEQIGDALDKMHTDGLIIAGARYTVSGPGGSAKARTVTQFYLRATDDVAAP